MSAKKNNTGQKKKRVLVVDDHPLLRLGLTQLINQDENYELCGEAEDSNEAMELLDKLQPDIAIVDITLKDTNGLELIKKMKNIQPKLPILVLSMHDEGLYAERALRAGAQGYIMKQEMTNQVVSAMTRILEGHIFLSDSIASKMLNKMIEGNLTPGASPLESLSDRELEVFQMMGEGMSTREIAEKLFLSTNTIDTYRRNLKKKLNLKTSNELVRYAIQWHESQS